VNALNEVAALTAEVAASLMNKPPKLDGMQIAAARIGASKLQLPTKRRWTKTYGQPIHHIGAKQVQKIAARAARRGE